MRITSLLALVVGLCLFATVGQAQINELGPTSNLRTQTVAKNRVGEELFFVDLEGPTGDIRLLGIGWDGTNYWATGANDMITAYLHQFDANWNLITTFTTGHTSWAWRDLSFDGAYLYASDSYVIDQIDRTTGMGTGTTIPSPISPARAQAYDPVTDTFWTASWSSDIYNIDRTGTYVSHGNILTGVYGMGWDDSDPAAPILWIWSQDGNGTLASEFDPLTGTFTGNSWDGNGANGIAGGCDVFEDATHGWMLLGMHQGAPDGVGGYTLVDLPLTADNDEIYSVGGGTVNFTLTGGAANAGKPFALLGSNSGTSPGTTLPGGLVLPLNRDLVTNFTWGNPTHPFFTNFQGNLDASGNATATLSTTFVPSAVPPGSVLSFAWMTTFPFDFVSNPVDVNVIAPPSDYRYDSGATDNLLGWYSGGDMCWMHRFDEIPGGSVITSVQTIWGSALYTGYNPPDGTAAQLFVWEDPTDDGDPSDIVLLTTENVVTMNTDTDIMNIYPLTTPVALSGEFYVGAVLSHVPGQYVVPMDMSTLYVYGDAFFCGTNTTGGFDPVNIMANQYTPAEYGSYWCVRGGF